MDTAYERGATDFFDNTIRPALLVLHFLIVVATPDAVLRPSGQDDWIKREIDEFTQGPRTGRIYCSCAAAATSTGRSPPTLQRASRISRSSSSQRRQILATKIRCARLASQTSCLSSWPHRRRRRRRHAAPSTGAGAHPAGSHRRCCGRNGGRSPGGLDHHRLRAGEPPASGECTRKHAHRDRIARPQAGSDR